MLVGEVTPHAWGIWLTARLEEQLAPELVENLGTVDLIHDQRTFTSRVVVGRAGTKDRMIIQGTIFRQEDIRTYRPDFKFIMTDQDRALLTLFLQ
jgi:hypothetical protein